MSRNLKYSMLRAMATGTLLITLPCTYPERLDPQHARSRKSCSRSQSKPFTSNRVVPVH